MKLSLTPRRTSRRAAFTLLEVLVVVAILVILASVASVATFKYLETARQSKAQLQAKTIATACDAYYTSPSNTEGTYPASCNDLISPRWGGSSFLKDPQADSTDPWGGTFLINNQFSTDGGQTQTCLVYTHSPKDNQPISQYGIGPLSRVQ